jgi:hypothetical protein
MRAEVSNYFFEPNPFAQADFRIEMAWKSVWKGATGGKSPPVPEKNRGRTGKKTGKKTCKSVEQD